MAKKLLYDNEAKQKILAGIDKLEKATSITLGPAGKNVIIDEYGSVHVTKDGVTVARSVTLSDPFENLGAAAVKEVAEKSNSKVGDGTTTSTLLAAEIFRNGLKYVSLGSNATLIRNGIKKAADFAAKKISENAVKISSKEDIKRVCTVSANGDEKIGEIISDVMDKIGNDGTIKVENGNTMEMTSKIIEGMVLDVGYVSPYMITKQDTMEADLDSPFILLSNKKLSNFQELLPCLQSVSETGRPLIIIGNEFQDDIIGTVIMNGLRPGGLKCVLVKSPSFGNNRTAILDDIAILTGGRVISDGTMTRVESAVVGGTILGQARRVLISKDSTIIFDGAGDQKDIDARITQLRHEIETTDSEYDNEKLRERLAKLASGIGIIQVGAETEAERKELRDRVDDAFAAAKCAVKSGVVAGGGSALLNVRGDIEKWITDANLDGDEKVGAQIFSRSLESPMRKILKNAGIDSPATIEKIQQLGGNYGFNVLKGQCVDMIVDGIIDAADVVVNEIRNSASIASLLLTTEALVVEDRDEKQMQATNSMQSGMM